MNDIVHEVTLGTAQPAPFEITVMDSGARVMSNGAQELHSLDVDAKVFRRRAVKNFSRMVEWAVCELGGVRVYFDGQKVIVTRRDMTP